MDWVTHENFLRQLLWHVGEKKYEGLAARLPRLSGTLEAAVGQELVNENLGTPQTGTRVRYGSKERNDYRTLSYRREKVVACLLAIPMETVPRLQVAV